MGSGEGLFLFHLGEEFRRRKRAMNDARLGGHEHGNGLGCGVRPRRGCLLVWVPHVVVPKRPHFSVGKGECDGAGGRTGNGGRTREKQGEEPFETHSIETCVGREVGIVNAIALEVNRLGAQANDHM